MSEKKQNAPRPTAAPPTRTYSPRSGGSITVTGPNPPTEPPAKPAPVPNEKEPEK